MTKKFETAIKRLITSAKKIGQVTLAQLNKALPDDSSTPELIEEAMSMIESAGLQLVVAEKAGANKKGGGEASGDDAFDDDDDFDPEAKPETPEQEVEVKAPAIDVNEKIDDPVRMYLTQMGEIPLLTREEEISLARKIELTRKQFRKEVLSSGFGISHSIEILEDVVRGELAFDRTLKVNQQDPEIGKADLSDRLPGSIDTLRRLFEALQAGFVTLQGSKLSVEREREIKKRDFSRKRKVVTLIEELNLQGKKISPMIDLLESRFAEMSRLQRRLSSGSSNGSPFGSLIDHPAHGSHRASAQRCGWCQHRGHWHPPDATACRGEFRAH